MSITYSLNDVDIAAVAALTEAVSANPENGATVWKAEVSWNGGFRSESRSRDFDPVASDEPVALGGTNTAPNPVEQLLAALGNCFAVGVAANATAREIEITDLAIALEGDLDLATFLGLTDGNAGFSGIRASIRLEADAEQGELDALIDHVVATSPVGHTLTRQVPLQVTRPNG